MKRILSIILCVGLLVACMPVAVQATGATLSVSCDRAYSAGQTFSVDICADQINDCCAFSARLTYDQELMEVVSIERGDAFSGGLWNHNSTIAENAVYFSLTGTTEQDLQGVLATVEFRAKTGAAGTAQFGFDEVYAYNIQTREIPVTVEPGQTVISPRPEANLRAIPAPMQDDAVQLTLYLEEATYFCGLSFVLCYDASRYRVRSVEQSNELPADTIVTQNPQYGEGKVFISLASAQEVTYTGCVAVVVLEPKQSENATRAFSVEELKLHDNNGAALPIRWSFAPGVVQECVEDTKQVSAKAVLLNLAAQDQECTAILAVYSQNGQMLSIAADKKTVAAGRVGTFEVTAERMDEAAYAKIVFLDSKFWSASVATKELLGKENQ